MLNSSYSWVEKCKQHNLLQCELLSKKLPTKLSKIALYIEKSSKSWEWKHFWCENAKLWLKQSERTTKLRSDWSEINDLILDDWNKSEFSSDFMNALNRGVSFKKSSLFALKELQTELHQMAIRHFSYPGKVANGSRRNFELGEYQHKALTAQIRLSKSSVEFYGSDKKMFETHLNRTIDALNVIKTYSPDSFQLFETFTKRVTPIQQKEFVSYSLQNLPGHSFINFYNRDFIDLIDDLLHENGHHHLNHFLILENPLNEDDELIYYSPWRRTLRPIRGIYHAHLTFYFALKIFHDLSTLLLGDQLLFPHGLNNPQKQKIYLRYLEEWYMLEYTAHDLKLAFKRKQIKHKGMKLFAEFEKEREKLGENISRVRARLNKANKKNISKLIAELKLQRKITKLN